MTATTTKHKDGNFNNSFDLCIYPNQGYEDFLWMLNPKSLR